MPRARTDGIVVADFLNLKGKDRARLLAQYRKRRQRVRDHEDHGLVEVTVTVPAEMVAEFRGRAWAACVEKAQRTEKAIGAMDEALARVFRPKS